LSARPPCRPAPRRRAAPLALALALAAGRAAAAPIEVRTLAPSPGQPQLAFEIRREGVLPERLVFWPHEGIAVGERFEPLSAAAASGLEVRASGAASWSVAAPQAPGVSVRVALEPLGDAVHVTYEIHNAGDRPQAVAIAPCLQLPDALFGGLAGWARAKRVFVVTDDEGVRWISDTRQVRGRRVRAEDPDPALAPWAQHFVGAALRAAPPAPGLALFGVAREHVAVDAIGASAPGSDLVVLLAAEGSLGATYSLLDCLHAGVGTTVEPGATRRLRARIHIFHGELGALLERVGRGFAEGQRFRVGPDFVHPRALGRMVESFESGGAAGEAPWRAPTDGAALREAELTPEQPRLATPLSLPEVCLEGAVLGVDVSAEAAGQPERALEVELALGGAPGSPRRRFELSAGKPRRLLLPLAGPRPAGPVALSLELLELASPARVWLDAVELHTPPGAECAAR
jgi:hypothetical protein